MKKKIGEIYNKPIVTGDKNLVTKNEIHESSLGGSSGGDGGVKEYYYKILSHTNDQGASPLMLFRQFGIALINTCIIKGDKIAYYQYTNDGDRRVRSAMEQVIEENTNIQAFSFLDIETSVVADSQVITFPKGTLSDRSYKLLETYPVTEEEKNEFKELFNTLYLNYFQEITKEEYESLITQ